MSMEHAKCMQSPNGELSGCNPCMQKVMAWEASVVLNLGRDRGSAAIITVRWQLGEAHYDPHLANMPP